MSTEDTKKKQEERAARLRRQIADIKEGKLPVPEKFKNPRDFIAEKMKEIAEKEQAENDEAEDLPNDE